MQNEEIPVPASAERETCISQVEKLAEEMELILRLRTCLAKYPGCTHWHFGVPGRSGTLEVTFWPAKRRCWISVQSGRQADWIEAALPRFRDRLAELIAHRPIVRSEERSAPNEMP